MAFASQPSMVLSVGLQREGVGQVDQRQAGACQAHEGAVARRRSHRHQARSRRSLIAGLAQHPARSRRARLWLCLPRRSLVRHHYRRRPTDADHHGRHCEFERGLIRERCEEGIARANRKGTKFGRPTALDPGPRRRDDGRARPSMTEARRRSGGRCNSGGRSNPRHRQGHPGGPPQKI
jgi:hypothetical protein